MATFNQQQLLATMKAVEEELNAAFAAERASLVKAEGDEKSPAESSDDAGGDPASASSTPPDSAPAEPPAAPAAAADSAGSPPPAAPPDSAPASPGADPAAQQGGGLTVEALQAEYSQLPPDELDMHIQAALSAKEALMAASAPAGSPAPGASPAGPGPASASPAPMSPPAGSPPPAMKNEIQDSAQKKANGGEVQSGGQPPSGDIKLGKAEDPRFEELAKLVKEQSELIKNQSAELEVVQKVLAQTLQKPMRKALTAEEYAARTAEPKRTIKDPADLKIELKKAIASGKLTQAERDDVVGFYTGLVKAEKLAPIIEKLQK